jgi:hypothetical protein
MNDPGRTIQTKVDLGNGEQIRISIALVPVGADPATIGRMLQTLRSGLKREEAGKPSMVKPGPGPAAAPFAVTKYVPPPGTGEGHDPFADTAPNTKIDATQT